MHKIFKATKTVPVFVANVSKEYFESKLKEFEVVEGDIIVSCAGTIGETYIMPHGIKRGVINQALMKMKI